MSLFQWAVVLAYLCVASGDYILGEQYSSLSCATGTKSNVIFVDNPNLCTLTGPTSSVAILCGVSHTSLWSLCMPFVPAISLHPFVFKSFTTRMFSLMPLPFLFARIALLRRALDLTQLPVIRQYWIYFIPWILAPLNHLSQDRLWTLGLFTSVLQPRRLIHCHLQG